MTLSCSTCTAPIQIEPGRGVEYRGEPLHLRCWLETHGDDKRRAEVLRGEFPAVPREGREDAEGIMFATKRTETTSTEKV